MKYNYLSYSCHIERELVGHSEENPRSYAQNNILSGPYTIPQNLFKGPYIIYNIIIIFAI